MKVLYIGHYKESTGWGKAARDYILALDAAGVEVVPRAIKLDAGMPEIDPRILELEAQSTKGCTHCIQHVLPHHLDYNGNFEKNIALCVYESFGADYSSWPAKINLMDELWVPSSFTADTFVTMGVNTPIRIIPHAFDLSIYDKEYTKLDNPELDGNFIFYTIADMNKRKDLLTLIQAFHIEFTANEPVRLLIKTSRYGLSPQAAAKIVLDECETIKKAMKLQRRPEDYSQEIVVTDSLSDEDIMRLHATGDCFVTTTHGEAWCIPLFDAIGMGKVCIYPNNMFQYAFTGGFQTYDTQVFGMTDTFPDIGSARETWVTAEMWDVRRMMRNAYLGESIRPEYDLSKFSHLEVGMVMKESLTGEKL